MAGADWPEDYTFLHRAMSVRGYGRAIRIVHDAIGGLRAGSPDGTGVAVVCGTGTAIGACAPDGRIWHTSFWQEPLELDRRALRAVYRAELGIDPPTSLTQRVLRQFESSSVEKVLHRLTAHSGTPPTDLDRLVAVLLDEADWGDEVARRIVAERGAMAGEYALAAARRVGIADTAFTLVLAGGVMRHPTPLLAEAIVARVRTAAPSVLPVRSRLEPAAGALFLALEQASIAVDESVLDRVQGTMPAASMFAT
jgi:N-acetylglucosamine kinase-like BadF-type ATPase